ncbi:zinc finger protein ush [Thrips palmi]|uniref:Zinc finger protein ush n=1 Tax=Thrips palmi TaxID=161013 RepID=A0A6P8YTS2_THRPL|nr:zinc finger protein ush [Thrips palmi]
MCVKTSSPTPASDQGGASEGAAAARAALAVSRSIFLPRAADAVAALLPNSTASGATQASPSNAAAQAQPGQPPAEPTEARQAVAFRCEPCGIRFSSLSTLEAHQTYYCSHRPNAQGPKGEHMRMHTASPPAATGAVAPPLPLPLQLQMQPAEPADAGASLVDRYCQDCDIRFSSLKTFRAHKLHYCSTRHVLKGSVAAGSSESASPSPVDGTSGPALPTRTAAGSPGHANMAVNEALLALPTNPPLLVPYSLLQAASVVQTAALSAALGVGAGAALGAACLLWLPDGSLQPVATANLPSANLPSAGRSRAAGSTAPPHPSPQQQQATPAPAASSRRQREAKQVAPNPAPSSAPGSAPTSSPGSAPSGHGPLDLSVRRASDCSDADLDADDNVPVQDHEHEDIVCAPSIPLMLSASSTCSSPSPAPGLGPSPSPPPVAPQPPMPPMPSRKRPHSPAMALSPTERERDRGKKSPRRTPNGVAVATAAPVVPKKEAEIVTLAPSPVLPPGMPQGVPAVPDPQLLLQSVLAGARLPQGLQGLPQGLAQGLPLLLGNPLAGPLELALRMAAVSAAELQQQVASHPPPPPPPQMHVKQGVSKCQECNIVFCRHENFLAHKRHYCQARLQDDEAAAEGSNASSPAAVTSRSPSASSPPEAQVAATPANASASTPSGPLAAPTTHVQYICARCHIKFTSVDNLTHHQAYYCPKRPVDAGAAPLPGPGAGKGVEDKGRRRCPKCKVSVAADQLSSHQCDVVVVGTGTGWRCPCCPVMSPTISAAQKHMETHNGIKAFRCTVCGYKGNTLRGMRTHIRMHFEKGLPDLQEENYIKCVMEDDAALPAPIPIPAPLATPPTAATDASSLPGAGAVAAEVDPDRQFTCNFCSFTSLYKSSILHHIKHAHGASIEEAASNSLSNPDDQRPSNALNGTDRVTIKVENQDRDFDAVENFKCKEEPVFISDAEERASRSIRTSPLILEDSKPSVKSAEELNRGDEAVSANNNKSGPKYCESCDISFSLYDSFKTHKKFYCRSEPDSNVVHASAL